MKIIDVLPSSDQIKKFRDIESTLLSRKTKGKIAGWGALLTAMVQVVLLILQDDLPGKIRELISLTSKTDYRLFIPTLLFILALLFYFLIRRTSFLMKETKEPFRYTFWIEPFEKISDTPGSRYELKQDDRLRLLHHDLTDLINERIKRFSILENPGEGENKRVTDSRMSSHIHIHGNYVVREDRENNEWVVHVMTYVRIGPKGVPETLAQSVKFPLIDDTPDTLDTEEYNQLLERVYSRITTEIYAQIEKDIYAKVELFPTVYLQANALYEEAWDMANSNTINAFESAIRLYEAAIRKNELTLSKKLAEMVYRVPVLRNLFLKYLLQHAKIQIGYAQCLIYKNRIASLSGRKTNPVFEIRENLKNSIRRLEVHHYYMGRNQSTKQFRNDRKTFSMLAFLTFPKDRLSRILLLKPSEALFNKTRSTLFRAYVVHSLTDSLSNAYVSARRYLDKAKAIAPDLTATNVLYMLAEGYAEADIDKALRIFQQATEKEPSFQIARYDFAFWSEMKFRISGEMSQGRANSVIREYEKVLQINPGNVAALTAQGNLLWLINDLRKAKRKFEEGCSIKSIISDTLIGQLIYGLARISAEEGEISKSYDLYSQAVSANPNVGLYSISNEQGISLLYYNFITPPLLQRYRDFHDKVLSFRDEKEVVFNKVHSYVLNDLANACVIFHTRFGDPSYLEQALNYYDQATRLYPANVIARYNHSSALTFSAEDRSKESQALLEEVLETNSKWFEALTSSIELIQKDCINRIKDIYQQINTSQKELKNLDLQERSAPVQMGNQQMSSTAGTASSLPSPQAFAGLPLLIDNREKRSKLKLEIEQLESDKNAQLDRLEKLKPLIRRIFELSRLITLFDGLELGSFEAEPVNLLVNNRRINWYKIDLEDIRVLISYAVSFYYHVEYQKYVSTNGSSSSNLPDSSELDKKQQACKSLLNLIRTKYYPEDTNLLEFIGNLEESGSDEGSPFRNALFTHKADQSELETLENNKLPRIIWQKFKENNILLTDYSLRKESPTSPDWRLITTKLSGNRTYLLSRAGRRIVVFQNESEELLELIGAAVRFWVDEDPENWNILNWAKIYLSAEEYFVVLERAARYKNNALLQFNLGNLYFDQDSFDKAAKSYTLATEANPSVPYYQFRLGQAFAKMQEWPKAIEHFEKAIKSRRKHPDESGNPEEYYASLLDAYHQSDRLEQYVRFLEKSEDLKNEPILLASMINEAGNLYSDASRWKEALDLYRKSASLDPARPVYLSNQALMHVKLNEAENATRTYKESIELAKTTEEEKKNLDYYYGQLANAYYEAGMENELDLLLIELNSEKMEAINQARIYNGIGVSYSKDQQVEKALPYFLKAETLDPNTPIYSCNIGYMHAGLQQWDKAVESYTLAIRKRDQADGDAYGMEYYLDLAVDAFYSAGKLGEFISIVGQLTTLDNQPKQKALIYNRIGNLYFQDNQATDARDFYSKAIDADPTLPIFISNLGLALQSLGEWKEAISYHLKAIDLRKVTPNDPYGLDYYFGLCANAYYKDGTLDSFLQMLEESDELRNDPEKKAAVFNQVGNLHFTDGDYVVASRYYIRALELDASKPVYFSNTGLSLSSVSDWKGATQWFQRAIELRRNLQEDEYGMEYYQGLLAEACRTLEDAERFVEDMEKSGDFEEYPALKARLFSILATNLGEIKEFTPALEYAKKAMQLDAAETEYVDQVDQLAGLLAKETKKDD